MVYKDVEKALMISAGKDIETFSKIYNNSNENLNKLFNCFSVKDKEVLTVLASSDHFFYTAYYGAKSIDTFDINPLTKYYYYLRMWTLNYNDEFYPSQKMLKEESYLNDLLQKVRPKTSEEEQAFEFWRLYLKYSTPKIHENLYCFNFHDHSNTIKNKNELKEKLLNIHPSFYHQDLFGEITCPNKYDIIITSNILEYGRNDTMLLKSRENLKLLLKPKGIVINSHYVLNKNSDRFIREKNIFLSEFDYEEFPYYKKYIFDEASPLGYSYQKKN